MLLESSSISWLVNRAPCNVTFPPPPEIRAYENHWFSLRWGVLNPYEDSKKAIMLSHSRVLLLSWRPRETSSQFNVSPDSKWWVACWVRYIDSSCLSGMIYHYFARNIVSSQFQASNHSRFLQIVPWDSSPFLPQIWENIFWTFSRHRTCKFLVDMPIALVQTPVPL